MRRAVMPLLDALVMLVLICLSPLIAIVDAVQFRRAGIEVDPTDPQRVRLRAIPNSPRPITASDAGLRAVGSRLRDRPAECD